MLQELGAYIAERHHAPLLAECAARVPCVCRMFLRSQQRTQDQFCVDAQVSGTVEKDGAPIKGLKLKGKWDAELVAEMPDGSSRRLWTINPPAADPTRCCTHASALRLSIVAMQCRHGMGG